MTIRFDEALDAATQLLTTYAATLPLGGVTIIRDLQGRLRLALECSEYQEKERKQALNILLKAWRQELGAFAPSNEKGCLFWKSEMFDPDSVFASPDRLKVHDTPPIYLLDRQSYGLDWQRTPDDELSLPVVAFYGLKGGVGRSTALAAFAYWLAEHGKNVLILDLDLESPGVGETLLPDEYKPDYGIVDWLIEDAVEQADGGLIREMSAASPISNVGDVRVIPAYGKKTLDYLPKLARAYSDTNHAGIEHFGNRLRRLLLSLIEEHRPDIVLLDSRAGLHDIAAAVITHLANRALLFATDSRQTWEGYRVLFRHWQRLPHEILEPIRKKLQVVASMIPEEGGEDYLENLLGQSWDTFREHLYDALEPDEDGFNFDRRQQDGPHFPIPVYRHRAFVTFEPIMNREPLRPATLSPAFGEFVRRASEFAGV